MRGTEVDAMSRDYAAGRRDTLKEVAPWLRHKTDCWLSRWIRDPAENCTCGLSALLKRMEGKA